MKKIALILVTVLSLTFVLTSCDSALASFLDKPETAEELWEKVNFKMGKLLSYELDTAIDISHGTGDERFFMQATEHSVFERSVEDIEYYYSASHVKTRVGQGKTQQNTRVLAFDGEKMFFSSSYNGEYSNLYSPVDSKEFAEFIANETTEFLTPEEATEKSFLENEDGTYSLTLSEFEEGDVERFINSVGFSERSMGFKIVDISVEADIDEKYRIKNISYSFFEKNGKEPTITMKFEYSNFNSASREELDTSGFTEVYDVKILEFIRDELYEIVDAPSKRFDINVSEKTVTKDGKGTENVHYKESDKVRLMNGKDGIQFDIGADINGTYFNIGFYLDRITYGQGFQTQYELMTKPEAKAYIAQILDSYEPETYTVTDITKIGDDTYRIDCTYPTASELDSLMASIGDTCEEYSFYYIIEVDEKELRGVSVYIEIGGKLCDYKIERELYIHPAATE